LARVEAASRDGTVHVRITGEIDLSNVGDVRDAIGDAVPHDAALVVVDLSSTAYLDSAGVAMMFQLARRLRFSRQEMRLVVPKDAPIRAVVELTDMAQVIPVQDEFTAAPRPE
jgi:anti-anti-sigma factor